MTNLLNGDTNEDEPVSSEALNALRQLLNEATSPVFAAKIFACIDEKILVLETFLQVFKARLETAGSTAERKRNMDAINDLDFQTSLQSSLRSKLHAAYVQFEEKRVHTLQDLLHESTLSPEVFRAYYTKYADLSKTAFEEAHAAIAKAAEEVEWRKAMDGPLKETMRIHFEPRTLESMDLREVFSEEDVNKASETVMKLVHCDFKQMELQSAKL